MKKWNYYKKESSTIKNAFDLLTVFENEPHPKDIRSNAYIFLLENGTLKGWKNSHDAKHR